MTPPSFETRLAGAPQDEGFWYSIWNQWYDQWWWDGLFLLVLGGLIFIYILIDTYRRKQPI